jgi:membrane protease YdiL (CAAX protease family)
MDQHDVRSETAALEESAPSARNAGVSRVFLGPHGLRAGWSVLLFATIWVLMMEGTAFFLAPLHFNADAPLRPTGGLLLEIWQFVPVIVATVVMGFFEQRPVLSYGFTGRSRAVRFVSGLVWGFAAISVLVGVLWKLDFLGLEPAHLSAPAALRDALLWGMVFLLTGFCEESFFRGYVQYTLTRGIGFWWTALLVAGAFGAFHRANPGESPVGLVAAGAVGLVFCLSLWYTGSLWWAVGFHAAWDWGQSYFYGTADSGMMVQGHLLRAHPVGAVLWSGGTTGPEGSVLILPLLAVIALLMTLWWGLRTRPPLAGAGWRPLPAAMRADESAG